MIQPVQDARPHLMPSTDPGSPVSTTTTTQSPPTRNPIPLQHLGLTPYSDLNTSNSQAVSWI